MVEDAASNWQSQHFADKKHIAELNESNATKTAEGFTVGADTISDATKDWLVELAAHRFPMGSTGINLDSRPAAQLTFM